MTKAVIRRESPTAPNNHRLARGPILNKECLSERELKACTILVSSRVTKHRHCASIKFPWEWNDHRNAPKANPPVHSAEPAVNPITGREKMTSFG